MAASARLTLAAPVRFEQTLRQSRFLARATAIESEADAQAFLQTVADPQATHNCWAWRLDDRYRSNDDGEPGGTAGRPILAAIDGRRLDRVMVVVTRYFGGIKLGAGGLVRAYSGTAAKCLDRATILTLQTMAQAVLEARFEHTGAVYEVLEALGASRLTESYGGSGVRWRVELPADDFDRLSARLRDATRGAAELRRV